MDAQHADDILPTFSHREARRVVLGLLLCILLAALDQTVVIPAVPAIASDLSAFGHLSWIVTAYLLTSTAMTPIYGKLSDNLGRRAVLIPAIALFVVASAACAMSQSLLQLIVARAVQGIGGAGLMSMAQAAIADVVAPRERGRYQAYMTGTWGFASVAGPLVGGYVTDNMSWRWVFWINLPIGLLAMYLSNRALRAIPVQRRPIRIDLPGATLLIGCVTSFLLLLSWGGGTFPWTSPQIIGLGLVSLVLLGLLVVQERRFDDPLLPPRLFDSQVFVCGVGISFFASLGMFACIFMLPLFFQLVHGANAEQSGQLVVPFLIVSTVTSYLTGAWMRRSGHARPALVTGLGMGVAGLLIMSLAGIHTALWFELVFSSLAGAGIGMVMPASLVSVQNAAERRDVGVATATMLFLRSLGGAFGSTLAGTMVTAGFEGALHRLGLARHIDLGSLRGSSDAFAGLPAGSRNVAEAGLVAGFSNAFLVTGLLTCIAFVIAWVIHDVPLRSAGEPASPLH